MIQVTLRIVTPPVREGVRLATSSKDSERQDEQHSETGTVESTRDKVHVVLEDAGLVVTEVVLAVETGDDPAENDAGLRLVVWDETSVLQELGHVDLFEA